MASSAPAHPLARAVRLHGEPRPLSDAASSLLEAGFDLTGSTAGHVFVLDPASGFHVPAYSVGDEKWPPLDAAHGASADIESLSALASRGAGATGVDGTGIVVYSYRSGACLGFLAFVGVDQASLDSTTRQHLVALAHLLVPLYERQFAIQLSGHFGGCFDFRGDDEAAFYGALGLAVAAASQTEFVVLRRRVRSGALHAVAAVGFPDSSDMSTLDLTAGEASVFDNVINTRGPRVLHGDEPFGLVASKPVRSVVALPVVVDGALFGVLTLGSRVAACFSRLELAAFEGIADQAGCAIANYRNRHELAAGVETRTDNALAIVAAEIAQSARHEATGLLDTAQTLLARILTRTGGRESTVAYDLSDLANVLLQVNNTINRIRTPSWQRAPEMQPALVATVFSEAQTLVAGRLQRHRIIASVSGDDVQVQTDPDRLRIAFLHLLLNSTDAFADRRKKGDRRIDVVIAPPAARTREIEITYRDNATGIDPRSFVALNRQIDWPVGQLILSPALVQRRTGLALACG